ncbi:hypothetical protein AB0F30_33890 [Streptomyces sp. NPDC029006]|uniref:hypothetical protein n=1 Tax=Streptomyces sp. NPDC029006 TaxID=3155467 RepID=UPI0033FEB69C
MWSLGGLDRLAAHYGIPVPELLRGVDHAVWLPAARRAACIGGTQTTLGAAGAAVASGYGH